MDIDKSPHSHPHHQPGTSNKGAHDTDDDMESSSESANKSGDDSPEASDCNDDLTSLNNSSLREKISSEVNLHLLLFVRTIPPKPF